MFHVKHFTPFSDIIHLFLFTLFLTLKVLPPIRRHVFRDAQCAARLLRDGWCAARRRMKFYSESPAAD